MAATATPGGLREHVSDEELQPLRDLLIGDEEIREYAQGWETRDAWGYREMLCRFFVARAGNVQAAHEMLRASFLWRMSNNIDHMLDNVGGIHCKNMQLLQRYWPGRFIGRDKSGFPVWVERFGHTDPSTLVDRAPGDDLIQYHIWVQEHMGQVLREANDGLPEDRKKSILRHVAIEDLDGLGMKHYHSRGLELFKQCVKIDESNYPERLRRLYVINAPTVFRMLWAVVKPWLDPRTLNKIQILGGDYREHLLQLIDEDQLHADYGGTLREPPLPTNEGAFDDKLESGLFLNHRKITVDRRGQYVIDFRVSAPTATHRWEFFSEGNDVAMGIRNADNDQFVKEIQKYDSHSETITGEIQLPSGNYQFIFDNTYSRFTSKTVTFLLSLEE